MGVIRRTAAGCAVMAMIKANGYGHGILEIAKIVRKQNVEFLGVAFVDEAIALRKSGDNGMIAVMTPPEAGDAPLYAEYNLRAVVSSSDEARELSAAARAAETTIFAHLYLDTGLSRDGVFPQEIPAFWEQVRSLDGLVWEGCCTHFATSEEANTGFARKQLAVFNGVVDYFLEQGVVFKYLHVANTGAITQLPESRFNLIRPGYSLYGLIPAGHLADDLPLKPVLSWKTKVLSVRRIPAGTSVSYGRRFTAEKETSIATLPVGYGDGYMRNLSGKQDVLIAGSRFPVVGTICMDEIMVDVGDAPVQKGDEVILIGSQGSETIPASELAANCNTIGYEIVTAISARVPRVYV